MTIDQYTDTRPKAVQINEAYHFMIKTMRFEDALFQDIVRNIRANDSASDEGLKPFITPAKCKMHFDFSCCVVEKTHIICQSELRTSLKRLVHLGIVTDNEARELYSEASVLYPDYKEDYFRAVIHDLWTILTT